MTGLRRADWRFLLPAPVGPTYRRLVVLGDHELRLRPLAPLADEVSASPDGLHDADAVVVTTGSGMPLGEILTRLRDDAVLYLEVDRRRAGRRLLTPGRVRRALERGGFRATAWHWAIPTFEQARRHVPLDSPAAIRWYLATLQTAGSPAARIADAGIRLLAWAGPQRLAAAVPCYSVTAVGRAREAAGPGVLAPPPAPVALLTSGQDDGSRVVLLPFENGVSHPSRVVKVSRLPAFSAHTEREQQTLAELRARLPLPLRSSLPEPLGVRRWHGLFVAAESYAPGAPLVVSTGRFGGRSGPAHEDLRRTVDWLIAFHQSTRDPSGGWTAELGRRTAGRFARCGDLLAAGSAARPLLEAAVSAAADLTGSAVPIVPLHNDLGPWNIHRDGARITVIDWELGTREGGDRSGPGPCDLFYFCTSWYLRARRLRDPRGEARGLRDLFVAPAQADRAAAAAGEEILRYTRSLGVEPRILPLLLVTTWVDRALEGVERAGVAATRSASGPEQRYLRYLEVLAARTTGWFAEGRWP